MNDIEQRIRAALQARAEQVTEARLTPADPPRAQALRGRGARRFRFTAPLLAAAAVAAVAIGTAVVVAQSDAGGGHRPAGTGRSTPRVVTSAPATVASRQDEGPYSSSLSITVDAPSDTTSAGGAVCYFGDASECRVPSGFVFYVPLWPFENYAQARQWQTEGEPAGASPWHSDPAATAQFFVENYLGFTDLTEITSRKIGADQAHIGIGYHDPNGTLRTAAVVHLVRYERTPGDQAAGWEVVGTDDTTFSLETPAYASTVASPVTLGGHITGLDEGIHVWARTLAGGVLEQHCCTPAGGQHRAWSVTLAARPLPASTPVLLVASTGGHLQQHERFAIQGVWGRH